jgi:HSP20 family protein
MRSDFTGVNRWFDPMQQLRKAQEDINRLFSGLRVPLAAEFPLVNVWAGPEGAIVTAQVPGVNPDDLEIAVHEDTVTLSGKRVLDEVPQDAVVHRRERPHGAFSRTFVLPFRLDADKAAAKFKHGVLTLDLARPAADKPRQIKVARA